MVLLPTLPGVAQAPESDPTPGLRRRSPVLTPADLEALGAALAGGFRGHPTVAAALPGAFTQEHWLVYIAARSHGRRLSHAWGQEGPGALALDSALRAVREPLSREQQSQVDVLEVDLAHTFLEIPRPQASPRWSNASRGLVGIELIRGGRTFRFAPTQMIAQNLGFDRALDRLREQATSPDPASPAPNAAERIRLFEAHQLLVELDLLGSRTTPLFRGNTVVPIEAITRPAAATLSSNLAQWLTTNLQPDGRMVYLYWPSRGEESDANNEIRQWMATVALNRLARHRNDAALHQRVRQNLAHNLARSYRPGPGDLGRIVENGTTVKLGAVALASLALVENPHRPDYAAQETALRRTVDHLWRTNGEFRTFLVPSHRTDNVNFYPGEALLLWATLFAESRDPALLDRIMTSVRFYRDWHLQNRNPAFIPWHTQACFLVWQHTRSDELRDWIFEMNDWLLGIQQWETQRAFPDTLGRFYDPDRPFGPPHASSTGVYLEGLIDAWRLARETGDATRRERYRQSIIRGLRSVTQLTFRDPVDLFYVSRRDRAFGGVRTTVYDNTIRVDNVQHNLMALLKILEHLPPEDFRP